MDQEGAGDPGKGERLTIVMNQLDRDTARRVEKVKRLYSESSPDR
jgi:hypothetical protein